MEVVGPDIWEYRAVVHAGNVNKVSRRWLLATSACDLDLTAENVNGYAEVCDGHFTYAQAG